MTMERLLGATRRVFPGDRMTAGIEAERQGYTTRERTKELSILEVNIVEKVFKLNPSLF